MRKSAQQPEFVPIKVAIVEDDGWIRENLATQLRETEGFLCAGAFRTGEEEVAHLPACAPDVVLLDTPPVTP